MIVAAKQTERPAPLRDAVITALRGSGYRLLGNLECEVHEGRVTLKGIVPSFYLKQVAQTIAMRIEQVREVHNGIAVPPR